MICNGQLRGILTLGVRKGPISAHTLSQLAKRILSQVGPDLRNRGLGVSIGLAASDGSRSFEETLREADGAMYTAKRSGGMQAALPGGSSSG